MDDRNEELAAAGALVILALMTAELVVKLGRFVGASW